MSLNYHEQPLLSISVVAAFIAQHGVNFSAWPQVEPPDEMFVPGEENAGGKPWPILRTKWGLITGDTYPLEDDEGDFAHSLSVHLTKGWNCDDLAFYADASSELLAASLEQYNDADSKGKVEIADNGSNTLFDLVSYFKKGDEEKAGSHLVGYLRQILETNILDRVIEVICADETGDAASEEMELGVRPELLGQYS